MIRVGLALFVLTLLAPAAAAVDLLPAEVTFGATEARLLVRSATGSVHVRTEPSVLVAAASPGGPPGPFVPAPRVLDADHAWRGMEGIVEVVLRRPEGVAVDVIVDDGARTGVWLEWPAARRETPAAPAALALLAALASGRLVSGRAGPRGESLSRPRGASREDVGRRPPGRGQAPEGPRRREGRLP